MNLIWKRGISLIAIAYFFLYLTVALTVNASVQEIVWKNVSRGITDLDLQTVAVSHDNAETVYIGSFNAIYKTINGGKSWNEILSFRGTGNVISSIVISPQNTKFIYVGTHDGLYRSKNHGMNWKKIPIGIKDLDSSILSVAIDPANPEVIFIGTKAGLFWTDNGSNDWKKGRNLPSRAAVSFIAVDHSKPYIIYAATDRGLHKSINSGISWERMFETHTFKDNNGEEYITSNEFEVAETSRIETKIKCIAIDPADTRIIYIGTSEGLFVTEDGGLTWKMVSSSGLISRNIRHLVISSSDQEGMYAATSRGVFRYSKISKSWKELYRGLTSTNIRFLSFVPTIRDGYIALWAVTKKGIFKTIPMIKTSAVSGSTELAEVSVEPNTVSKNIEMEAEEVLSIFADEPSIAEIREAAIRYAEVHPEKIKKWRKAAAKKAWLPDLRIGYDWDRDWQSSTYFYSTTTQKYRDDDITREKDRAWSISLTWELGDLIWNDDQTSIDTRSRLMVQLRDDLLNEVTRLYFERRKLQIEMLLSPPVKMVDRIEKELRLQELTADIDALTGSYISRRLAQIKDRITNNRIWKNRQRVTIFSEMNFKN